MAFGGVVHQLKRGKSRAAGITGLGQQRPGPFHVIVETGFGAVTVHFRRGVTERRNLTRPGDFFHNLLPVNGHGQGLPYLYLIERRCARVEQVVIGGEERKQFQDFRPFLPVVFHLVQRRGARDMQLAGAEHALFRGGILDRVEDDPVQLYGIGIPVMFVLLHHDTAVQHPFLEFKRAVAHVVPRAGPAGAALVRRAERFYGCPVHREVAHVRQQLQEKRRRVVQFDHQGQVVGRLHAHLGEIRYLPPVEPFRVPDVKQHIGIVVAQGRQQRPAP